MSQKLYQIRKDDHGVGDVIIPSCWNEKVRKKIEHDNIKALRLSFSLGFKEHSIDFVKNLKQLKSIEVYSPKITDFSPISELENIEVLGIQFLNYKNTIDFKKLKKLRVAMLTWGKHMDDLLFIKSLEYLNIINYPFQDLTPLSNLLQLEKLYITSRKLESLEGIQKLENLKLIDLYNCPFLKNIEEAKNNETLEIKIEACRYISK